MDTSHGDLAKALHQQRTPQTHKRACTPRQVAAPGLARGSHLDALDGSAL